jgi:hypothetical protein
MKETQVYASSGRAEDNPIENYQQMPTTIKTTTNELMPISYFVSNKIDTTKGKAALINVINVFWKTEIHIDVVLIPHVYNSEHYSFMSLLIPKTAP